jgi:hypothetical protein
MNNYVVKFELKPKNVRHARFFDTDTDANAFAEGLNRAGTPCVVSPAITPEAKAKAEALRAKARGERRSAQESFDRCDTDGFLSQWASGICADRDDHAAQVAEMGGVWEFPALFDLQGNLVAAKVIKTSFGMRWGVLASDDPTSRVVKWLAYAPARKSTLEKHGYREGSVLAPAIADIRGEKTAYAGIFRKGPEFRRDVEIVNDGGEL